MIAVRHRARLPVIDPRRSYRNLREKSRRAKSGSDVLKSEAPPIMAEPCFFSKPVRRYRSATEEQPQQNNHRNRYAEQPKQKSSSHRRLLESSIDSTTRRGRLGSGKTGRKRPTNVRCSASKSTAPPVASHRPSAATRSNADPASE